MQMIQNDSGSTYKPLFSLVLGSSSSTQCAIPTDRVASILTCTEEQQEHIRTMMRMRGVSEDQVLSTVSGVLRILSE